MAMTVSTDDQETNRPFTDECCHGHRKIGSLEDGPGARVTGDPHARPSVPGDREELARDVVCGVVGRAGDQSERTGRVALEQARTDRREFCELRDAGGRCAMERDWLPHDAPSGGGSEPLSAGIVSAEREPVHRFGRQDHGLTGSECVDGGADRLGVGCSALGER